MIVLTGRTCAGRGIVQVTHDALGISPLVDGCVEQVGHRPQRGLGGIDHTVPVCVVDFCRAEDVVRIVRQCVGGQQRMALRYCANHCPKMI